MIKAQVLSNVAMTRRKDEKNLNIFLSSNQLIANINPMIFIDLCGGNYVS